MPAFGGPISTYGVDATRPLRAGLFVWRGPPDRGRSKDQRGSDPNVPSPAFAPVDASELGMARTPPGPYGPGYTMPRSSGPWMFRQPNGSHSSSPIGPKNR